MSHFRYKCVCVCTYIQTQGLRIMELMFSSATVVALWMQYNLKCRRFYFQKLPKP